MKILISRYGDQSVQTFGNLTIFDGEKRLFECVTLELPDLNNQQKISCILKGKYKCAMKGATENIPYNHIELLDEVGRTGICIHIGNFASLKKSDVKGCIIVGTGYKDINQDGILDIVNSKITFDKIMSVLPAKFDLEIV